MKRGAANGRVPRPRSGADIRRNIGDRRDAFHQRTQIQAGAADDDGALSGGGGSRDFRQRQLPPAPGGARLAGIEDAV